MTPTFQPPAPAGMAVPNAAVDFPFPSPVFTITIEGALLVARAGPSVGAFFGFIGADPNASRGSLRAVTFRQLRTLCMSLPEVEERETWGESTFRFRERVFVIGSPEGHSESINASLVAQAGHIQLDATTLSCSH